MSTISHRILNARMFDSILAFKENYHDAIHGIVYGDINVIDEKLNALIDELNKSDSIDTKVNVFMSLIKLWFEEYCNIAILRYIFKRIPTDTIRGIHIQLNNHKNKLF